MREGTFMWAMCALASGSAVGRKSWKSHQWFALDKISGYAFWSGEHQENMVTINKTLLNATDWEIRSPVGPYLFNY
jgi:hypothetical protein